MRRLVFLLILTACSSETGSEALPPPNPQPGDRPPLGGKPVLPAAGDPNWPTACGGWRQQKKPGACLEAGEKVLLDGLDEKLEATSARTAMTVRGHEPTQQLANGHFVEREEEVRLEVPANLVPIHPEQDFTIGDGAASITFSLSSQDCIRRFDQWGAPTGFLCTSAHWNWNATAGTITCYTEGRRALCAFRHARFLRSLDADAGAESPAPLPDDLLVDGWVHGTT